MNQQTMESKPNPEQMREDKRRFAAQAIQRHFSSHPDCVIVASIADGKLKCDVTPTAGLGELLVMERIIKKKVAEAFDNTLAVEQKMLRDAARESDPSAPPVGGAQ